MRNDVRLTGWVGEKPQDYPAKGDRQRFVKFELAINPADSGRPAQWVRINAYGEVADRIIDGLWVRKGDQVRIEGYLSARTASPGCGRKHRFTVVCVNDIELIEGSNDRPEKHWKNVEQPPALVEEKPLFQGLVPSDDE